MKKLFYVVFAVAFMLNAVPASVQAEWVKLERSFGANEWISDFATSGNHLFAGTDHDGIYRSTDNGGSWVVANGGVPSYYNEFGFRKLTVRGNDLFSAYNAFIYISTDNGDNWVKTSPAVFANTIAANGNNIFVGKGGGNMGGVFFSTDGGKNWTNTNQPTTSSITGFTFIKDKTILASYVGIFISTDNGTSWQESNVGLTDSDKRTVYSIVNIDNILFIGTSKGMFLSTDEGANWNQIGFDETVSVFQMATYEKNIFAWVVGNWPNTTRGLFVSLNGGLSWKDVGSVEIAKGGVTRMAVSGDYLFLCTGDKDIWRRQLYEMVQTKVEQPSQPEVSAPATFSLAQNYPNPFNSSTAINYSVAKKTLVKIAVFDASGRMVAMLADGEKLPGQYALIWTPASALPSGLYFCRLVAEGKIQTKKMTLVK